MISSLGMTGLLLAASTVAAQVTVLEDSSTQGVAEAQSPSVVDRAKKTIVQFELLSESPLSGGIRSQEWAETLQKLDVDVRIRQPRAEDKPGVTEKTRGTLRWVSVVGLLDSAGQLVLPDRTFSSTNTDRLREWIDELKLYGAQGAPAGKPLWGLSKAQFNGLFTSLSTPIPQDFDGETLAVAIQQLNLPPEHPVRFHSTATEHLSRLQPVPPVNQRLAGVTNGTGFAAVLAESGLGFRPLRTPAGEIEFVVQPLGDISDPWPVGWELQKDTSRLELAPELFKMVPVKFDDIALQDVFDDIARTTGRPIIVDHYSVGQKGINLIETTLSYPAKRVAWMQVIHSAAVRNGLTENLRIDERGQPFVHVSPFVPHRRPD